MIDFGNKKKIYSRREHEQYCQEILEKAKLTVLAFVMDMDGTVRGGQDPQYKKADAIGLLQRIARKGKYPSIVTASGISALKSFSPLEEFCGQENIEIPIFIGIGNGTALYRFDEKGKTEIYNNELTLEEVKEIVAIWTQVYDSLNIGEFDLQPKGLETFKDFINTDWGKDIPEEYVDVFRQYGGKCFAEKIKVTVVFPKWENEKQRDLVGQLQLALNHNFGPNKYLASRGDDVFLHITRALNVDPKLFALQAIMNQLKLNRDNVAVFGDMPLDNDRGLLVDSDLLFSFTNRDLNKKDIKKPPFILPGSSESQVGSVYQAIDYLLS